MRGALVLVDVCKCLPDKCRYGHHAGMLALENLAIFSLVFFEVVVQPPLYQLERKAVSTYHPLETDEQEQDSPEKEAYCSVVDVMQGVT